MSRVFPRRLLARAVLLTNLLLGLNLCNACLQSSYVLRADAAGAAQGGAPSGPVGGVGSGGESPPAAGATACEGLFRAGSDFAACAAAYWASSGVDALHAVVVSPLGDTFVAGQSEAADFGVPTLGLDGSTTGVVARVSAADGAIVAVARVGASVSALALVGENLVVGSDVGVAVLSSDLARVLGQSQVGGIARLAASASSLAALTTDRRLLLLDGGGSPRGELDLAGDLVEDVAIDAATGLVVVTGSRDPVSTAECLGKMPFVHAYDQTGARVWTAYGFDDAPGWCASSTGRRLVISRGKLFYAGEQQGGNSVHLRDPNDLSVPASLISYDDFSSGTGKATREYSFVARFDLASGAFETGQVIVPRSNRVGGTLFTSALAVDQAGRIFLGGHVTCCIEGRDQRRVSGELLGPYAGDEASLLVLSADLRERLAWTTFTSSSGAGLANVEGIAVNAGFGAAVSTTSGVAALITVPPGSTSALGKDDGYFVTFPVP